MYSIYSNSKQKRNALIERILVIGIPHSVIQSYKGQLIHNNQIELNLLQKEIKVLEDYKSNNNSHYNRKSTLLLSQILPYLSPNGIQYKEGHNHKEHSIISFTLSMNNNRKHISALQYYENYTISGNDFSLTKLICIVSSFEIYDTMTSILNHLYKSVILQSIINNTSHSEKLDIKYLYIKNKKSYIILQENKALEFIISFLLHSLYYDTQEGKYSYLINSPNNNFGFNTFLSYSIESKDDIPLKDYSLYSIIESFNVDDLIKIYGYLIMGYKLVLLFEDYSKINQIIHSLLSILYPLKWKKFPIISFISDKNSKMLDMIESPISVIIGVHLQYKELIKEKVKQGDYDKETIIYNLVSKSFISINTEAEMPSVIVDELKLELHKFIAEAISIDKNIEVNNTEYYRMFGEIKGMNKTIYYNYKIISIFYNTFLELVKNINNCIKKPFNSTTTSKDRVMIDDYFDMEQYSKDIRWMNNKERLFFNNFSTSMLFNEFLYKYIVNYNTKAKYKNIHYHLILLNYSKNKLKTHIHQYIKSSIISYYNFTYISMDSALEQYYSMLQELSLSKRKNSKEYNKSSALWYPLEIYKVYTSSGSFDHFITNKAKDGNLVKIINEVNQAKSPKKKVVSNKIYDEDNNVNASFEDESTILTSLENKSKSDNTICLYHNIRSYVVGNKTGIMHKASNVSQLAGDTDDYALFSE